MRPYADLFFMGAAFLLLETKNIATFALLFGTTWLVNALVFAGVLVIVLAAVETTRRFRTPPLPVVFGGIAASLAVCYFVQPDWLLTLPFIPRLIVAILLAFVPIYLANVAFSKRFGASDDSRSAFGLNLLGAMLGGCLEYLALLTGYRNLLLMVAGAVPVRVPAGTASKGAGLGLKSGGETAVTGRVVTLRGAAVSRAGRATCPSGREAAPRPRSHRDQSFANTRQHRNSSTSRARVPLDPPQDLVGKALNMYAKRKWGKVMDNLMALAHNRKVLLSDARFEMSVARWNKLDPQLKALAVMATATQIECSWCMDFGYYEAHSKGMDTAKIERVTNWRDVRGVHRRSSARVLEYAEAMTATPPEVTDEMVEALRADLGDAGTGRADHDGRRWRICGHGSTPRSGWRRRASPSPAGCRTDRPDRDGRRSDSATRMDCGFRRHRDLLFTVAYEITGSVADAEDVVQESYLRWPEIADDDRAQIRNPRAYLAQHRDPAGAEPAAQPVPPAGGLCRALAAGAADHRTGHRRRRRAGRVGVDGDDAGGESLSPDERAVFVLHEVFGFTYDEIADAIGKSAAAVRQIAHRARSHVQARRPRFTATTPRPRRWSSGS